MRLRYLSTDAIRCKPENRSTPRPGSSSRWSTRAGNLAGAASLSPGDRLGFDPWLQTTAAAESLPPAKRLARNWSRWTATRSMPFGPSGPPAARAGHPSRPAIRRRNRSRQAETGRGRNRQLGADALVLSDSHAVAWAFNIRGGDVAHTPLPFPTRLCRNRPADTVHRSPQARRRRPRPSRTARRPWSSPASSLQN